MQLHISTSLNIIEFFRLQFPLIVLKKKLIYLYLKKDEIKKYLLYLFLHFLSKNDIVY